MAFLRNIIWCIPLLGLLSTSVRAQDIKFEYLTPDEGLSQSTVASILQDKAGFMWFGTGSGLNKYDGYTFTKYYHRAEDSTSIAGDNINCIFEDRDGDLWIANDGGLSLYNRDLDNFINYLPEKNNPNSLSGPRAYHLYEDKKGQLWIGNDGTGLNMFNRKENTFIHYRHNGNDPNSLSNDNVRCIIEDNEGRLWVSTENGGLNLLDPKTNTFAHFYHDANDPGSIPHSNITSMTKDKGGNIWFGTLGGGICRLSSDNSGKPVFETFAPVTTDANRLKVLALFANQRNGMWIGTENGGLDYFDYDRKTFVNFQVNETNPNCLNNNSIHALFEDKAGNIWVGTYTGGVNVVKRNTKKIYTYRKIPGNINSLSYNAVSCFYEDIDGKLWVGTDGGGVNICDRNTGKVVHLDTKNSSMKSNAVLAICSDGDQDVWVGGWDCALNLYNRKSMAFTTFTSDKNGIPNNNIYDFLLDRKGRLWMTFGGFGFAQYHKSSKTFTTYTTENSDLNSSWVLNLVEDFDGNIILGHTDGFSVFNPEKETFKNFSFKESDENSLSNNQISIIMVARDSTYWIGTINGLNHFDPGNLKFTRYYVQNGLPSNNITGLVEDDHGELWISTSDGISKFEPQTGKFKNYNLTDGLQGKSFIRNSCYKSAKGEILFGGTNGYNIFLPDSLHDNSTIPPVVITGFTIFNKPVAINVHGSPLKKDISQTKKITLTYKQSVFSFEYVALDYTAPGQNQYAYKLEGFEDDWNYVGTKRLASYTNLDAGNYVFRVKGSNNDGIWNEEGASLMIKIKPPFWKTWIFRIAVILILASLVYFFVRQRIEQVKKDKEILEKKIREGEEVIQQKMAEVEHQREEIKERDKRELEIRFMNEGIAKFSSIIVSAGNDIKRMSTGILAELVDYVGIIMGAVFVVHKAHSEDIYLEMESSYALDREHLFTRCKPGEGYVGTCYNERKTILITDIPKGYAKLSSGLGEIAPNIIYLIPLKYSDMVQGVIEVASLRQLEEYKVKFIEKIAENISSFISIAKAKKQTEILLEQADVQRNELQAQEEELKQNLEEMMATQEEMKRREEAWITEKATLRNKEAEHLKELKKLKNVVKEAKSKNNT